MTGPAAQGVRIEWAQIPAPVRAAIEDVCGGAVVQARTQPGGFSPGLAARVRCANGARYFVKAVSAHANPDTPGFHRQEARVLAALEPVIISRQLPIPRLHGVVDRPPWIALVLQDIAGRQPQLPWRTAELQQVVAALDQLADALTPAPVPVPAVGERLGAEFTDWRTLAASPGRDHLDPLVTHPPGPAGGPGGNLGRSRGRRYAAARRHPRRQHLARRAGRDGGGLALGLPGSGVH